GDNVQIKMVGMESTFDMGEGVSGLFLGDATFDLAQFEFAAKSDEEGKQFSVRGLNMKTSSHALTDTVNYSLTLQANQVVMDGTPHGPGSYQLELRKLDAATLAKFQQVLREIHSESPHRTSQDINQMMLARYAALLPDLMKKSPEIELNYLSFKTTDGDFLGKAKIVVNGTNAAAFANPLLLLNAVTAHAEFSITDRLLQRIVASTCRKEAEETVSQANQGAVSSDEVEVLARAKAEERLEALVAQNILIHEGGRYRASADYQLGQVILNSRLITLQDLFQQG
ncbi:MAG: DUF945 family protein, partial [Deltaproteobacteria bacterium]